MEENTTNDAPASSTPPPSTGGSGSKKGLMVGVVVALIVAAIVVFVFGYGSSDDEPANNDQANQSDSQAQDQADSNEQDELIEVFVSEEGFDPEVFVINVGDTIRWTNDGSDPHHIASDPYPESDTLPALNSTRPVGPGDYYEYTFTEAGEFGYHDRLNPTLSGQVVVE